jgi:hypothetical protein
VSEELKLPKKPAPPAGHERAEIEMNNCDVMNAFAASDIEAKSFSVLATASKVAAAAKNRAHTWRLAGILWSMNRDLANLVDGVHKILSGETVAPAPKQESNTPQEMRTTADNLEHITRTIDYILELSRRARLTNNSLTAGSLNSLSRYNEELRDFADWIETLSDPKYSANAFDRAKREKEAGEIYDLSRV